MKTLLVFAAGLALSGCASSYIEPALPTDHPANPAADEAPRPQASRTLDLSAADPVIPVPGGARKDREGHDMDDMTPSGPSSPEVQGGAEGRGTPSVPEGAAIVYACPMHPEVTSDKADQRCPKCGMALVKQDQETKP